MKKLFAPLLFFILVLFFSCKKNTPENANENLPSGTVLVSGTFTSNNHPTTGRVKVIKDVNNRIHLAFENFKTDNGPDIYVWLSPNTNGSPYEEIGLLKAVSGNFSYELGAGVNYTSNYRVLIWCKRFSVLFGQAVLQ
jgi:hypothetical protein